MAKSITKIEGIGPKYGAAFRGAGIRTVDDLLEAGADRSLRLSLSEKTNISEKAILRYVNMADLFRINGVASQYAELLESAGVDTVKELRNRNAENLTETMAKVNSEKNLVRRAPSVTVVNSWITQAKGLQPKVNH